MFNLGFGEILLIAFIFIIVVGPDKLPELLRTLGKTLRSVQKANQELQSTIGIDKLRQELLYPKDLQDALKWRPKPTYHSPLAPPADPAAQAQDAPPQTPQTVEAPATAETEPPQTEVGQDAPNESAASDASRNDEPKGGGAS
jgi:Tat protein translocase TatB subunit